MSDQADGGRPVETAPKKRGMARLILGTLFVNSAVLQIAFTTKYAEAAVSGALGAFLIWWGAHGRAQWMRPLGITWIVVGVLSVFASFNLQRAANPGGGVFQGTAWVQAGDALMVIVGVVLLFGGERKRVGS